MNKNDSIARFFTLPSVIIPALGVCSCLLGAFSALWGGFILSFIVAIAIGLFCLACVLLSARRGSPSYTSGSGSNAVLEDRIDPLTGLANENGLMAWFSENATRLAANGKGIIVFSADLDGFDLVEQTYGKDIANNVLIEVSRRVASCTGP